MYPSFSREASERSGVSLSFQGLSGRPGDEAIGRHPRRIPRLQGGIANRALKTIELTGRGHRLGAPVDGSASGMCDGGPS